MRLILTAVIFSLIWYVIYEFFCLIQFSGQIVNLLYILLKKKSALQIDEKDFKSFLKYYTFLK